MAANSNEDRSSSISILKTRESCGDGITLTEAIQTINIDNKRRKSRRVSFAETYQVREFVTDDDKAQQGEDARNGSRGKHEIPGLENLLNGPLASSFAKQGAAEDGVMSKGESKIGEPSFYLKETENVNKTVIFGNDDSADMDFTICSRNTMVNDGYEKNLGIKRQPLADKTCLFENELADMDLTMQKIPNDSSFIISPKANTRNFLERLTGKPDATCIMENDEMELTMVSHLTDLKSIPSKGDTKCFLERLTLSRIHEKPKSEFSFCPLKVPANENLNATVFLSQSLGEDMETTVCLDTPTVIQTLNCSCSIGQLSPSINNVLQDKNETISRTAAEVASSACSEEATAGNHTENALTKTNLKDIDLLENQLTDKPVVEEKHNIQTVYSSHDVDKQFTSMEEIITGISAIRDSSINLKCVKPIDVLDCRNRSFSNNLFCNKKSPQKASLPGLTNSSLCITANATNNLHANISTKESETDVCHNLPCSTQNTSYPCVISCSEAIDASKSISPKTSSQHVSSSSARISVGYRNKNIDISASLNKTEDCAAVDAVEIQSDSTNIFVGEDTANMELTCFVESIYPIHDNGHAFRNRDQTLDFTEEESAKMDIINPAMDLHESRSIHVKAVTGAPGNQEKYSTIKLAMTTQNFESSDQSMEFTGVHSTIIPPSCQPDGIVGDISHIETVNPFLKCKNFTANSSMSGKKLGKNRAAGQYTQKDIKEFSQQMNKSYCEQQSAEAVETSKMEFTCVGDALTRTFSKTESGHECEKSKLFTSDNMNFTCVNMAPKLLDSNQTIRDTLSMDMTCMEKSSVKDHTTPGGVYISNTFPLPSFSKRTLKQSAKEDMKDDCNMLNKTKPLLPSVLHVSNNDVKESTRDSSTKHLSEEMHLNLTLNTGVDEKENKLPLQKKVLQLYNLPLFSVPKRKYLNEKSNTTEDKRDSSTLSPLSKKLRDNDFKPDDNFTQTFGKIVLPLLSRKSIAVSKSSCPEVYMANHLCKASDHDELLDGVTELSTNALVLNTDNISSKDCDTSAPAPTNNDESLNSVSDLITEEKFSSDPVLAESDAVKESPRECQMKASVVLNSTFDMQSPHFKVGEFSEATFCMDKIPTHVEEVKICDTLSIKNIDFKRPPESYHPTRLDNAEAECAILDAKHDEKPSTSSKSSSSSSAGSSVGSESTGIFSEMMPDFCQGNDSVFKITDQSLSEEKRANISRIPSNVNQTLLLSMYGIEETLIRTVDDLLDFAGFTAMCRHQTSLRSSIQFASQGRALKSISDLIQQRTIDKVEVELTKWCSNWLKEHTDKLNTTTNEAKESLAESYNDFFASIQDMDAEKKKGLCSKVKLIYKACNKNAKMTMKIWLIKTNTSLLANLQDEKDGLIAMVNSVDDLINRLTDNLNNASSIADGKFSEELHFDETDFESCIESIEQILLKEKENADMLEEENKLECEFKKLRAESDDITDSIHALEAERDGLTVLAEKEKSSRQKNFSEKIEFNRWINAWDLISYEKLKGEFGFLRNTLIMVVTFIQDDEKDLKSIKDIDFLVSLSDDAAPLAHYIHDRFADAIENTNFTQYISTSHLKGLLHDVSKIALNAESLTDDLTDVSLLHQVHYLDNKRCAVNFHCLKPVSEFSLSFGIDLMNLYTAKCIDVDYQHIQATNMKDKIIHAIEGATSVEQVVSTVDILISYNH